MRELVQLVEAHIPGISTLDGSPINRVYEVYEGDFVCVRSYSANGYWHDYEKWLNDPYLVQFPYHLRRRYAVYSDGGYIGHWETIDGFYHFLVNYMRANILEILTQEDF